MPYFRRILILPLGSFEYHGPELPPDTDTIIANRVATSLWEHLAKDFPGSVILLPALSYGLSLEHNGFPNTAFISHTTYYNFVMELVQSSTLPKDLVVFVNAHGGNVHTISALEADFNCSHRSCKIFSPRLFHPLPVTNLCIELFGELDAHAGSVEASMIAFYKELPARQYTVELPKRVRGSMRFFRNVEVTSNGIIKKLPTVIVDPNKGLQVHEAVVGELRSSVLTLLDELSVVLSSE